MHDVIQAVGPLPGNAKKTRQHIVPQWLQRGFSRSTDPKRAKVAVYRRDAEPLWTNIVNVGVRKSYFTSTYFDGDISVTELDSQFAAIVEELRGRAGPLTGEDKANACRLFAHLEVRQHATERTVREMWTNIIPTLLDYVRNQKKLQDWLRKPMLSQRNCIDAIERSCTSRLGHARARRLEAVNLRETIRFAVLYIDSFKALVAADVARTRAAPDSVAKEYAKRIEGEELLEDGIAYNRSKRMLRGAEAKSRIAGYAGFRWKIVQFSEDVTLPDAMVFHEVTDSSMVQNYLYVPARQLASYLPISARSALVGRAKPHKRRLPNAVRMRQMAARASFEFFVAAERKEAYQRLASSIGKHRAFATATTWRVVAEECLAH